MKRLFVVILAILSFSSSFSQKNDSISDELKRKIIDHAKNFSFGFYVDAYYNMTFGGKKDTSNIIPFSANCPVHDQIRLNVAAIEIIYNNNIVRGKLQVQFGDAPNLLTATDAQFIKNLRQANFGFRIVKDLWIDFGYILNPVGYESTWPVTNYISTATIGGYYEPGMLLGAKLSYKFSPVLNAGVMFGNAYSLAYSRNTHMAGVVFLNYTPFRDFTFSYNAFFGNQALKDAEINNNILYNNFIFSYKPYEKLLLVIQADLAGQTNSAMAPDTSSLALMYSGFFMARYSFTPKFSLTGRYETFYDPEGFLSGVYNYEGHSSGLRNNGFTAGFEFKPVPYGYMRLEYRMMFANSGNKVWYSNTSDRMEALTFTTGIKF